MRANRALEEHHSQIASQLARLVSGDTASVVDTAEQSFRTMVADAVCKAWESSGSLAVALVDLASSTIPLPDPLKSIMTPLEAGRYGVILAGDSLQNSKRQLDQMVQAGSSTGAKVSVGYAEMSTQLAVADQLILAADKALVIALSKPESHMETAAIQRSDLPYPVPENESERLAALKQTGQFTVPHDEVFDTLAEMAAMVMGTETALISLVGADSQWFRGKVNHDENCSGRDESFCTYTMLSSRAMVVRDAQFDRRFRHFPVVVASKVRFYAGAPIVTDDGFPLGALCVSDQIPRNPTKDQVEMLERLARQASRLLDDRRKFGQMVETVLKAPTAE